MDLASLSDEELHRMSESLRLAWLAGAGWFTGTLFLYGLVAGIGGLAVMFEQPHTGGFFRLVTLSGLGALAWAFFRERQYLRKKASCERGYLETLAEQNRRKARKAIP